MVDPDGCAFWSAGLDCVRVDTNAAYEGLEEALVWLPDREGPYAEVYSKRGEASTINYLAANFIRAFGPKDWHDRWAEIALAELRKMGFNTVANWSEWEIARGAPDGTGAVPYVRPLEPHFASTPLVYRDFPDVYDPRFVLDAAAFAEAVESAERHYGSDPRFAIEHGTFAMLGQVVAGRQLAGRVDGLLLDLGVSSPQLDDAAALPDGLPGQRPGAVRRLAVGAAGRRGPSRRRRRARSRARRARSAGWLGRASA